MYLQLTTRCNMSCRHCCMNTTTTDGIDMPIDTFKRALELSASGYLVLGGGEPTVHPEFLLLLDLALAHRKGRPRDELLVVTNGKRTSIVNKLLDMIDDGVPFQLDLSRDEYHDAIDQKVLERFANGQARRDKLLSDGFSAFWQMAGIRRPSKIYQTGAAIEHNIFTVGAEVCCCPLPLIDPEGFIWDCACKRNRVGHVTDNVSLQNYLPNPIHKD